MGRAKDDTRSIEETLSVLEIDKDLDPEEAAQNAAQEAASSVVVETPGKAEIPDPDKTSKNEDVEDEDEEDEGEDADNIRIPPPKTSAPLPDLDEPVLVPVPRPPKARTRQAPVGAAKLGKELANKVPGAEKVKVYKREKDGKVWFVHEYTKSDLAGHTDFEGFLTEYVKDEHGPGEYTLKGVDGMGREMDLGVVRLRGTPPKSADQGALSIIQEIMAQNQRRDAEYLKRMEETMRPQPQQDPLSLLTGVMTLQKQLKDDVETQGGRATSGMESMVQMLASSGDKTMQMMMMMMQQQQQAADRQNQLMMTLLSRPQEEDPVTKLLLMKLLEDKKEDSGGGNLPPPPPPPKDNTIELITALAGFMSAMGGGGEGDDDFKEFLKQQLSTMSQDKLSTKDVLELVGKFKDESKGSDKLKEAADNMALVMNMAHNFNRNQEGGASAGIFDALAALFSNRDFAGSIAQTIRSKVGGGAPPTAQLTPQQQYAVSQLPLPQQQAFRQLPLQQQVVVAQRAAALQQQQMPPQVSQTSLPPGYVMTPQGPVAVATGGGPPAPATTPSPVPSETTQKVAEQRLAQREFPELPSNTYEHVANLATAADDAELVGRTIAMLIYFAEFEAWRPFSEAVLALARDGNKAGCMEYLEAFFSGMAEIHMIEPELARKTLAALRDNFETVREQLADFGVENDDLLTGEDLLAGADPSGEQEGGDVEDDEEPEPA
jgi:hypothetical protein